MSASRSSRSSKSRSVVRSFNARNKPSPAIAASRPPWIFDGIDYGPARAAVRDLANWALDIAEKSLDDWPAARLHVRKTRRFIDARIGGKRSNAASLEDLEFTATLLTRIFDEDLGLGLSEVLTILDSISLPVDAVPVQRRAARVPVLVSLRATPQTIANGPMQTSPAARVPPLRFCDDCAYVHEHGDHVRHRNAA